MMLTLIVACVGATAAMAGSDIPRNVGKDIEVLDQRGQRLNFRRDLLGKGVVAINFIFTRCTASCPISTATFRSVQKQTRQPIVLISISVDPINDTPERLSAYADKFQASRGWHFVTGSKPSLDKLLAQLGIALSPQQAHTNEVIVGNAGKGRWTRLYGLPKAEDILSAATDVR